MQNAPLGAFSNTFDLHEAIIGHKKTFFVFLRVVVLDCYYCIHVTAAVVTSMLLCDIIFTSFRPSKWLTSGYYENGVLIWEADNIIHQGGSYWITKLDRQTKGRVAYSFGGKFSFVFCFLRSYKRPPEDSTCKAITGHCILLTFFLTYLKQQKAILIMTKKDLYFKRFSFKGTDYALYFEPFFPLAGAPFWTCFPLC